MKAGKSSKRIFTVLIMLALPCLSVTIGQAAEVRQLSPTQQPVQTVKQRTLQTTTSSQVIAPVVQRITPSHPSLTAGGKSVVVTLAGSNLDLITSVQVMLNDEAVPSVTTQLGDPVSTSRQVTLTAQSEAPTGEYKVRLLMGSKAIDLNASVVSVIVSELPIQTPPSGVTAGKTTRSISPARKLKSRAALTERSGVVTGRLGGSLPDSRPSGTVMIDTVPLPEKPVPGQRRITPKTTSMEERQRTQARLLKAPGYRTDTASAKQYAAAGAEPRDAKGITTTSPSPGTAALLDKATNYSASKYNAETKTTEASSILKYDYTTERSDVQKNGSTLGSTAQAVAKPSIGSGNDKDAVIREGLRMEGKIESILNSAPRREGERDVLSGRDTEITVRYRPKDIAQFSVRLVGDTLFSEEAEFSSETMPSPVPGAKAHLYFPSVHEAQVKLDTKLDLEIIYPKIVVPGEVIKLYPKLILGQSAGYITDVLKVNTQVDYDFGIKLVETEEGPITINTKDLAFLPPGLLSGSKTVIPWTGQVTVNQSAAEAVTFRIPRKTVDAWHFPKKDIVNYIPNSGYIDPFYDLYIEADYTVTHDPADNIKVVSYGYSFDNDAPDSYTSSTAPITIKIPDNRGLKAGDVLIMYFDKIVFDNVFEYKVIVDGNAAYWGEVCVFVYAGCTDFARIDIPMNNKTIGDWTEAERVTVSVPRMGLPSNLAGSSYPGNALRFEIVDSVANYTD